MAYHYMVVSVLEKLRDAVYPNCDIRGPHVSQNWPSGDDEYKWDIYRPNTEYEWPVVSVTLIFKNDYPDRFNCNGLECALREESLIETLKRLHAQE